MLSSAKRRELLVQSQELRVETHLLAGVLLNIMDNHFRCPKETRPLL